MGTDCWPEGTSGFHQYIIITFFVIDVDLLYICSYTTACDLLQVTNIHNIDYV